jgi:hypothetical protein
VAALESHHAISVIREPVHDLAFAFVTPLGTDHDYVVLHFHFLKVPAGHAQP